MGLDDANSLASCRFCALSSAKRRKYGTAGAIVGDGRAKMGFDDANVCAAGLTPAQRL